MAELTPKRYQDFDQMKPDGKIRQSLRTGGRVVTSNLLSLLYTSHATGIGMFGIGVINENPNVAISGLFIAGLWNQVVRIGMESPDLDTTLNQIAGIYKSDTLLPRSRPTIPTEVKPQQLRTRSSKTFGIFAK